MQMGFCWVETSLKDDDASKTWRRGDDHHSHAQTAHRVLVFDMEKYYWSATVNQHPPEHHPLDAPYYWVVDEPQLPHLSLYLVSPW